MVGQHRSAKCIFVRYQAIQAVPSVYHMPDSENTPRRRSIANQRAVLNCCDRAHLHKASALVVNIRESNENSSIGNETQKFKRNPTARSGHTCCRILPQYARDMIHCPRGSSSTPAVTRYCHHSAAAGKGSPSASAPLTPQPRAVPIYTSTIVRAPTGEITRSAAPQRHRPRSPRAMRSANRGTQSEHDCYSPRTRHASAGWRARLCTRKRTRRPWAGAAGCCAARL